MSAASALLRMADAKLAGRLREIKDLREENAILRAALEQISAACGCGQYSVQFCAHTIAREALASLAKKEE